MDILIIREHHPLATPGTLRVIDRGITIFRCRTLELPWMNNQRRISRVPNGSYLAKWEESGNFRTKLWELKGVPGRSEVKFHHGNFTSQIEGCVLLGIHTRDINQDTIPDVTSSRTAMRLFHEATKPERGNGIYVHFEEAANLMKFKPPIA